MFELSIHFFNRCVLHLHLRRSHDDITVYMFNLENEILLLLIYRYITDGSIRNLMLSNKIKTLIIDDEWLIRSELKSMLMQYSNLNVIGEASNLSDAIQLFNELKPDLIFLDIQLPDGSGFDFLKSVTGDFKLIFITAFDQYSSLAKKYKPLDYLMKPINKHKLSQVIQNYLMNGC